MSTKAKNRWGSRDGGALVMVMLVLLTFGVLQIGLYKLRESDVVESVFVEHHKQAFWLAESGLNDGQVLLNYDKDFRDNPTALADTTVAEVGGSYSLDVSKTTIDYSADHYQYTVISTGTVRGVTRVLQTVFESWPGGKYAIIGIDGHTELAANVTVIGPIAQIEGTLEVKDSRYLDGYLIMGDGEDALTDRKGEAIVANYPPPPSPQIEYGDYLDAMAKAVDPSNHVSTLVLTADMLKAGEQNYYDADVIEFAGTATTIPNGTSIVNTGSITFPKSHVTLGNDVVIIADNVEVANQADIGGGTLIFSKNDIVLRNASDTTTVDEAAVALIALGDIELNSQIDFRGVMFAGNEVHINANGTIEGTLIGGVGVEADANITITYDGSVFKAGTPITPKEFGDVILSRSSWKEVPSL